MLKKSLITRLLWSAAAQSVMVAAALAADGTPAAAPPLAPPTVQYVPARDEVAANDVKFPEPSGVPDATPADQPAPSPSPAPQPEAAPAGVASPGHGPCPKCGSGCGCHCVDCREMPFGACVRAAVKTQICNGLAARFVLYQYDFCDAAACDGYKLSPKGYERLEDIARLFPSSNYQSIVIESTPDPKLDAARRNYVWQTLLQMNMPVPDQLVVVGHYRAPSLNGQEAVILHVNLLKQTQAAMPIGGGASGGLGSSGMSSAGSSSGGNQGH